mmetsp:Transcript_30931/g.84879  ORF Transcript_30931/g.84879 Transcript_30931/m.84879 type:complete len:233 (+) Transcript_30931:857-1555(+)
MSLFVVSMACRRCFNFELMLCSPRSMSSSTSTDASETAFSVNDEWPVDAVDTDGPSATPAGAGFAAVSAPMDAFGIEASGDDNEDGRTMGSDAERSNIDLDGRSFLEGWLDAFLAVSMRADAAELASTAASVVLLRSESWLRAVALLRSVVLPRSVALLRSVAKLSSAVMPSCSRSGSSCCLRSRARSMATVAKVAMEGSSARDAVSRFSMLVVAEDAATLVPTAGGAEAEA